MSRIAVFMLLLFAVAAPAAAQDASGPFRPHYVSQRVDRAYLREVPTFDHKILWVYRQRGYPFREIARFDIWRRVEAPDGTRGWMSSAMLSDKRSVLVTGKGRARILKDDAPDARLVGLADPGAIAGLKSCTRDYCRIEAKDIDGWIEKSRIWGADAGEVFKK